MATVSVVHFNKVLQNSSSDKREIIILRKNPHILPQPNEDILITNTGKKKKSGKEIRTAPQPMAVARRNARERNRVKQVNNGFANLRQHIPNFIAQAFESTSGRSGNKKLSKVETLRMAVEYIRSLEDLLAMDGGENGNNSASSNSPFPSPSPSSPTLNPSSSYTAYNYTLLSPSVDDDDLSTNSTPPPQFIRVNQGNTYIMTSIYDNNENLGPLNVDDHILTTNLIDTDLEFSDPQELSLLNNMHPSDSLSPGMYSEQSLSPSENEKSDSFIPVFSCDKLILKEEKQEIPVISLKNENELPHSHKANVIDVMQWWEQQPPAIS